MKRLLIVVSLAAIVMTFIGCQSMALKSSDANERMKAVKAITEQEELLEIARNKDYKNDVRLNALSRLTKQRGIWRVWCENGENQEIADKALDLLDEEDLLARVALLHSYEESAEEKEERESSEKRNGMALGAASLAVNIGGAAAASKANDTGGKVAAGVGAKAASIGLAAAFSEQKAPEPNMSMRTNEALIAVGKLKTLPAISTVALSSTIESVQLNALRRLLYATKDVQTLKDVACEGCLRNAKVTRYRNLDGDGENILRQNKIIAIRLIQDSAALTNVIDRGYGESRKYAFARLIQMKDFDVAAQMLCKYDIGTFLSVANNRDISDANAAKLVARFSGERNFIKLALDAKSLAVAKVAAERVKDESALLSIARKTSVFDIFKSAICRISDERSYEDIVLAGGNKSEYAIGLLRDTDYILMVFGKADNYVVRTALAKKIAVKDITTERCSNEKNDSIKKILFDRATTDVQLEVLLASAQDDFRLWAAERISASHITVDLCESETHLPTRRALRKRAPDYVKSELAKRRVEKIKKAVTIAEKDGKELLELVATKKRDQIDAKKVAAIFSGRLLLFRNTEMWNNQLHFNGTSLHDFKNKTPLRNGCLVNTPPRSPKAIYIEIAFDFGHPGVKERLSQGDSVSVAGIVNPGRSQSSLSLDGDVITPNDELERIIRILDTWDPDEVSLDLMLKGNAKSPTMRYAESVGWEFSPKAATESRQDEPEPQQAKKDEATGETIGVGKKETVPGSGSTRSGEDKTSADGDLDALLNSVTNQ